MILIRLVVSIVCLWPTIPLATTFTAPLHYGECMEITVDNRVLDMVRSYISCRIIQTAADLSSMVHMLQRSFDGVVPEFRKLIAALKEWKHRPDDPFKNDWVTLYDGRDSCGIRDTYFQDDPDLNEIDKRTFWENEAERQRSKAIHAALVGKPTNTLTVFLIGWPKFSATPIHDHGSSHAHVDFIEGCITEGQWRPADWDLTRPQVCKYTQLRHCKCTCDESGFDIPKNFVHCFSNLDDEYAVTLHAYSPRLSAYDVFNVEPIAAPVPSPDFQFDLLTPKGKIAW